MRKTEAQIESKVRERFELMAVRCANHLKMSSAKNFADLPPQIREHLEGLRYSDIIRPLVLYDRSNGATVRQLSIKYARAASTIQKAYLNGREEIESPDV